MIKAYFLRWLWMIIIGIGFVQNSFALQVKSITENGEVSAVVAAQDLTRIAVDNDRIVRVRGLEGAYELKHDAIQGALFIRPTTDYQSKPFTLFIATEQNHNYVLHLTPKEQWGDTIILKPKGVKQFKASQKNHSCYTKKLVDLMTQMSTGSTPTDYEIHSVTHSRPCKMSKEITIKLTRLYSGEYLQGYVYRVTNHSQKTLVLAETGFYQYGDRAISLSQLTAPPGGHVYLYKVRRYE